jgi:hypothetical protein
MSPMIGARDEAELPLDFFRGSPPRSSKLRKKRPGKKPVRDKGAKRRARGEGS